MNEDILFELDAPFRFTGRPFPVMPEFRPLWGMCLTLLLVANSRSSRSSRSRLQVLAWGIRSDTNMRNLLNVVDGKAPPTAAGVRYDPMFDYSLSLCLSENLVDLDKGKTVELSDRGSAFIASVTEDKTLLVHEKRRAGQLCPRINERVAEALIKLESL